MYNHFVKNQEVIFYHCMKPVEIFFFVIVLDILQRNKSKINGGVVSFYVCMMVFMLHELI